MMRKSDDNRKIEGLLPVVLLGVFAVCALMVLLLGADVYGSLTQRARDGYDSRTAAQYLTTRFRQADAEDALRVEPFGGVDALVCSEVIGGETYETRIYCVDGYLWELFSASDGGLTPRDGEKVLPLAALTLDLQDGCLEAELTETDGAAQRLILCRRSGEEAAP